VASTVGRGACVCVCVFVRACACVGCAVWDLARGVWRERQRERERSFLTIKIDD
jgi:hypothetical protein